MTAWNRERDLELFTAWLAANQAQRQGMESIRDLAVNIVAYLPMAYDPAVVALRDQQLAEYEQLHARWLALRDAEAQALDAWQAHNELRDQR